MELKFSLPSVPILAALGSNRTFMELKFNLRIYYQLIINTIRSKR